MAEDVFGIVGSVIAGTYHVERVVAEGGFGVVYRAHHGGFRAPVALKLLKVAQQSQAQREEFLELFRAEAQLLFRLSASLPTVVRPLHVDAFSDAEGRFVPYMVMEWLEGMTLDALIKQRSLEGQSAVPLRKLVRLLTPVARALERAHNFSGPEGAISIVHRDLKPENIFIAQVAGEEVVKILDFGIGKVRSAATQVAGRLSQDGKAPTAFTPAYGAPEQWAPRHYGQTGPWTDVWGLALCIVETLAGRPIIDGDPPTMMGITLDAARRPTPRNEGIGVSDEVEAVFAQALALDPRVRQGDAGIFWNDLTAALQVPESERGRASSRDARAEDGRAPRIELVERPSRPVSGRPPARAAAIRTEDALTDLEFDPLSARGGGVAEQARASALHFVPDLELAPPSVQRRPSGAQPALQVSDVQQSPLDLDEPALASPSLDLDLPSDEPLMRRAASSPRLLAVSPPAQRQSTPPPRSLGGAMGAARDSVPPVSVASGAQPRASVPPPAPEAASPGAAQSTAFGLPLALAARERPLIRRLRLAFVLLAAAVLLTSLDPIYAAATGEVLEVLGLRLSLFGVALLLVALALAAREALREA